MILILWLGLPGTAGAQDAVDIVDPYLKITLSVAKSRKATKGKQSAAIATKLWTEGCAKIGDALLAGKGPWGYGAFKSFGCYRGKKHVAGDVNEAKADAWTLTVVDGVDEVGFTISRRGKKIAQVRMPPSEYTLNFLEDAEFADLIAFSLLDAMPMALRISSTTKESGKDKFAGRHWSAGTSKAFKYDVPPPPVELVLYRLSWDRKRGLWRSQVVGTASRGKVVAPKQTKEKKKTLLVGGSVEYVSSVDLAAAGSTGPLWAQDAAGPGSRQAELQNALREAHLVLDAAAKTGQLATFLDEGAGLVTSLLQSAASGYVGLRYGIQVLPSEGQLGRLLDKTSIFSLVAEVRGGPAKGLRYYYDKLPETKATLAAEDGSDERALLAFSRHTLGFSLGIDPGYLVDRLTVDPKLGMWEFHARLPTSQNEDGKVLRSDTFEIGRSFSLAAEVGAELLSEWYTLRGWYAIDTGFSLLKSGGRVTSNRLGIDAYFTAGPVFGVFGLPMKTALLAFYVYEAVSIEAAKTEDPAPGEDKISGIDYSTGYAGGGVAISW